ncbi:MAG: IclR family transcriptional regulator, partial [Chloroflexi bacterium]|nr:IclR family transcriptional regulator [Chloroflexota bacterium]
SGIVTMAVPILRDDGIVGALAVSGPEGRCGLVWGARVARLLPDAARTVEDALDSP